MEQDRSSKRRRVFKSGKIIFGPTALDCVVRDISEVGARIAVKSPLWFPDNFVLGIPSDGLLRHCHIVWRQDGQFGLAFDD
ncbi:MULTISPECIES: PilZ domain-containing protein [Bradyrhizobium]